MASLNKIFLIGLLGKDPEIRYINSGKAVCTFTLATSEKWKDANGEWKTHTEWHRIVIWGQQGERAAEYLKKGSCVFIEGKIQSREWEDTEGNKRATTEIVAHSWQFAGTKEKQAKLGQTQKPTQKTEQEYQTPPPEDDIPF